MDAAGKTIGEARLSGGQFSYRLEPKPWYRQIHLDLFGTVQGDVVSRDYARLQAGLELGVSCFTAGLYGSAGTDRDIRAMLSLGVRWRAF